MLVNITPSFAPRGEGVGVSHGGPKIITLGYVAQRMDNNIHWINHCLVDSVGCFSYTYPMHSNLSREECYPLFETLDSRLNSSGNCFVFLSDEAQCLFALMQG